MSVRRDYTLQTFAQYMRSFPKSVHGAIVKGIHTGVVRAVGIAQRAGDAARPASERGKEGAFDTGNYRRKWRAETRTDGGAVTNDATYAAVIEGGRQAGAKMPPRAAIVAWAKRRLGLSTSEAESAAFPIMRAIARRGLRPRAVLAGAELQIEDVVMEEVERAVDMEIDK